MDAQVALLPHFDVVIAGRLRDDAPIPLNIAVFKEPLGPIVSTGLFIGYNGIKDLPLQFGVVFGQHGNGIQRRSQATLHIRCTATQDAAVTDLTAVRRKIPFGGVAGWHHIAVAVEDYALPAFFAKGGQNVGPIRNWAHDLIGDVIGIEKITDEFGHRLHIAGRVFRRNFDHIAAKTDQILLLLVDNIPDLLSIHLLSSFPLPGRSQGPILPKREGHIGPARADQKYYTIVCSQAADGFTIFFALWVNFPTALSLPCISLYEPPGRPVHKILSEGCS